jgi:hypothetical protein
MLHMGMSEMLYTRRDIGKLALAAGASSKLIGATKPDSRINGVQIGAITYSWRSMPDQSAEAILKYCVDSGISAIELMAAPLTDWTRRKGKWDGSPAAAVAAVSAPPVPVEPVVEAQRRPIRSLRA